MQLLTPERRFPELTMHLGLETFLPLTTILYLSAVAAFVLSIFWKPQIGLYYLVPLLPLQTIRYRLHEYPMGALMVDFILLGVGLGLWRKHLPIFPKTRFNRITAAFAGLTYILLFRGSFFLDMPLPLWTDDPRMQDWLNYMVIFLLLFLTFSAIRTRKQITIMLLLMALSLLALNKSYYNNNKDRDVSHFSYDVRQSGPMGYAGENGFAAFEAQCAAFLLALYTMEKRIRWRAAYLALFGFCCYCVLFSFSRGAYAAMVVCVVLLGVLRKPMYIVSLLVVFLCAQSVLPPAVIERVTTTREESGEVEASAGERLAIWRDALDLVRSNAALGTGFNTYAYMNRVGPYSDTHNLYLKILVETGIVGLGLFLILLRRMFVVGYSLYHSATDPFLGSLGLGFTALMAAVVVGNIFGDRWTYLQITGFTFTLLGLCLRAQEIVREEAETEAASGGAEVPDTPLQVAG